MTMSRREYDLKEDQAYGVKFDSTRVLVDGDLTERPGRARDVPVGKETTAVVRLPCAFLTRWPFIRNALEPFI